MLALVGTHSTSPLIQTPQDPVITPKYPYKETSALGCFSRKTAIYTLLLAYVLRPDWENSVKAPKGPEERTGVFGVLRWRYLHGDLDISFCIHYWLNQYGSWREWKDRTSVACHRLFGQIEYANLRHKIPNPTKYSGENLAHCKR
ncbi:hypothetical protein FRC08_009335 [Ceratobasidium sp. 394]|nr:hypothetical protein FRC08_009335 [Ceratobasidium sp. 394]